jgi:hypothetical protein
MRFVPGARATVFLVPTRSGLQAFRYWLDTQKVEQLTFDSARKNVAGVVMWQAPEFGNDYVLMVLANNSTELRVYRQVDKANPQWSLIYMATEANHAQLSSPEMFIHNGKSYIFVSATVAPNDYPSGIYLSNIEAGNPMFRQITPDDPLHSRRDPEVFVTTSGPFIYYNRVGPAGSARSEGIFRADTGLGPPVAH